MPPNDLELRLGLAASSPEGHYALGRLSSEGRVLEYARLPEGVERFRGSTSSGLPFACWCFPRRFPLAVILRWLWCDLPFRSEYVVCIDEDTPPEDGWWSELSSRLQPGVDVVGPVLWNDYPPGEVEFLRTDVVSRCAVSRPRRASGRLDTGGSLGSLSRRGPTAGGAV